MNAISANDTGVSAVLTLYREWQRIHAVLSSDDNGLDDPAWEAMHEQTWRISDEAMQQPATSEGDVLAKVMMFTCSGDHELPKKDDHPQFWRELNSLTGGAA